MVRKFEINKEKTINSALFVLQKLGGACDFHKLFKILYFADQKHLAKFGFPISGDWYKAMKDGPVPSRLYDVFQYLRDGNSWYMIVPDCHEIFEIRGQHHVAARQQPDMEELSESDLQCLLESIEENKNLSFGQLREKSHQRAWDAANNDEMDVLEIAAEGGASEEMLNYIKDNLENQALFTTHANIR